MTPQQEQQLAGRAQAGDHAALADLLQFHQHKLYSTALRIVLNRDDAAEITQDALLRAIEHLKDYNGQAAFGTWLTRILINLALSLLRKRKLRLASSLDAPSSADDDQSLPLREQMADSREPDPATSVQRKEAAEHLREALSQLDEEFRSVIVLRDLNQLDYAEIATCLDLPVGTVKSRLFRARLALRQVLVRRMPAEPAPDPRSKRLPPSATFPLPGGIADA